MRTMFLVGVLGAVLGGGGTILSGRFMTAKAAEHSAIEPAARGLAADLIEKLKSPDPDKFPAAVYGNTFLISNEELLILKTSLVKAREQHAKSHGKTTGEYELVREQSAGPAVVRFVYVEKFERGGVAWYFLLYRGSEGWKIADVKWDPTLNVAFAGF